ncbi:Hypothetical protein, putative [Bodo saltans]|uniref:C-CAP/cofactor C-like domain-containing protein n=1 Tax=Bodo saltans TaxID=75058 RepID=A0A0S4J111_BODSA|nr:Hypothetical protein, putative [Bodo saltans]|eukprot:CUG52546.1 Hypothetical protein, putative [Bodo saltans]
MVLSLCGVNVLPSLVSKNQISLLINLLYPLVWSPGTKCWLNIFFPSSRVSVFFALTLKTGKKGTIFAPGHFRNACKNHRNPTHIINSRMGQTCSQIVENFSGGTSSQHPFDSRKSPQTKPQLLSYQRDDLRSPSSAKSSTKPNFVASTNPADYAAVGLEGMKWERLPGQVNDQRINIDKCKHSQFFLVDQCDSVQIDECQNCVFFIGPTSGSVFLRNCVDCVFIIACGQLRLRDTKRVTISLFTQSRPVIESSSDIKFACFSARHQYFMLDTHLRKAKLSSFNNLYWYVHDFTPSGRQNYSFIPQTEFESSYDVSIARLQQQGGNYATTFDAVPVLAAGIPQYISPDEDLQVYLSEVAIPYVIGLPNVSVVVPQACLFRTIMIFSGDGLDEARRLVQLIEIQRREYYALQGAGPADQQVFLIGSNEKIITLEDMSNILSISSSREFWNDPVVQTAVPTSSNNAHSNNNNCSNVVHVANKNPAVVENTVKDLQGCACICICLASHQENPPLLAGPRVEIARSQRVSSGRHQGGATQQQLLLDLSRSSNNEAMSRLLELVLCKFPMGGSGFGATH